jgi:nitrous oxide reductase accessory protein NosL
MRSRTPGAVLAGFVLVAGCHAASRAPAIRVGRACAGCGMAIEDLRFACERGGAMGWRQYDSIECLLHDPGPGVPWLADYDTRALAPAESVWVVRGEFPSPMGAGLAAFRARGTADDIASRTRGRVARLAAWAAAEPRR